MGLTLGPKMIQSLVTQLHPRRLTNTGFRTSRPTKPIYLPVDNATRHLLASSMVYSTSKWPSATPQVVHCEDQTISPSDSPAPSAAGMGLTPTFTQSMSGYPRGGSPMLTLTTATYTPHSQLRGWQPLNPNTCRVGTMVGDEGTATCLTNTTMWRQSNLATGAFQSAYVKWGPPIPPHDLPQIPPYATRNCRTSELGAGGHPNLVD